MKCKYSQVYICKSSQKGPEGGTCRSRFFQLFCSYSTLHLMPSVAAACSGRTIICLRYDYRKVDNASESPARQSAPLLVRLAFCEREAGRWVIRDMTEGLMRWSNSVLCAQV